jgi:hypothetical protein
MTVLQDIWILNKTGIVLFNRVFDAQMKSQLFGGLMSALNTFAEKLADGGLSNFELSDKKFFIKKAGQFIFVTSSSKKAKEKKVTEQLDIVVDKFLIKFPEQFFEKWDSDVSIFEGFEKEIESSLENPIKRFWNGF